MQGYATESSVPVQLVAHFGLRENPFGVTPDPRFLFHSQTHREALASLINGIDCGFGFQVLIAQPGMGKTSLLFNFLERFRTSAHTAFLFQPQREPHELLQSVLYELGTSSDETCLHKLSEQLNQVLYRAAQEKKRVIVVVDEAQNLEFAVLEALRQLSNFETPYTKLMQIVLSGQPQLAEKLASPEQEQLLQRISSIGRLSPLTLDETQAYIHHRLKTAGFKGGDLFSQGAVRRVWNRSKGVPRNINTLCFNAMLLGFAEHAKFVDERILKEAARDLDLGSLLEDVYQGESSAAVSGGNGKAQPIKKAEPPATGSTRPGAIEEAVADAGEKIPQSLVDAIARISQALEEQKLILAAQSPALPQAPSPSPVIPSDTTAADAKTPASSGQGSQLPSSAPIESTPAAAIRGNSTANLEKNSPPRIAERDIRSKQKSATDLAPQQPGKTSAQKSPVSGAPVKHNGQPTAKIAPGKRSLWPEALALAAVTGVLAFVFVQKYPLPRLGLLEASAPGGSAVVQNDSAAGYKLPSEVSASPTDGRSPLPKNPATDAPEPRNSGSDQPDEAAVRKSSTDANVTAENSGDTQPLGRIFFNEDSAVIDRQYHFSLQHIAEALAQDPAASAILEGHTDGSGPEAYNLDLSSRRAIAVRNALVNELHVSRTQLTAIGAGSAAPLQSNSNAAGRAYNRRVEVRLRHSSESSLGSSKNASEMPPFATPPTTD